MYSVNELLADDIVDNQGEVITSLFNGYTPVFQNPLTMVSDFMAKYHALEKRVLNLNLVMTWPTFSDKADIF